MSKKEGWISTTSKYEIFVTNSNRKNEINVRFSVGRLQDGLKLFYQLMKQKVDFNKFLLLICLMFSYLI